MSIPQVAVSAELGQNFAVAHLGAFSDLHQYRFGAVQLPFEIEGKVFLKQLLQLTSSEISLNTLPPQASIPFYHKHRLNEEIYLFIQGRGDFQVDGRIFAVQQGSVVRVDPNGERCIRNCSDSENLAWIVVQAKAGSDPDHTIEDGVGVAKPVTWDSEASV